MRDAGANVTGRMKHTARRGPERLRHHAGRCILTTMTILALPVHVTKTAASAAGDGHAALYETCAALIIAVLVVLYFDERVRRGLTARSRGYAIGSLGGIIGVGLLTPVLALAGIINDTAPIRTFTAIYTLSFLTFAFGIAIQNWGHEDGARMRAAQASPPVTVPPVPVPSPRAGQTEREHAAEVMAATMTILSQAQPDAVTMCLAKGGPTREAERLRQLNNQWLTMQPALIATSIGYPAAQVRERTAAFTEAAAKAMAQPAILFADKANLADGEPPAEWQEQAAAAYATAGQAFYAVADALHADESPGPKPAANGGRAHQGRSSGDRGASGSRRVPEQR
jgi:hypothetical protein